MSFVSQGPTHQKALEPLGLGDVNPAVFLDHFDVLDFVIESGNKIKAIPNISRETNIGAFAR